ncbi:MAG TPA: DUF3592 domain-containing protein [Pseudonocardiaceae bacterium]|jgi:hypothetical protein|nr:DUF3592 domain-containing protein [Pseudonocardiaceae bacterium]
MVADVVFAGPDGLGETAPRPDARADSARQPGPVRVRKRRGRRIAAATLLVLACAFSGLCLLLLVSTWNDDRQIEGNEGKAVADVLSVAFNRTAVRFVTPDGTVVIPSTGVLYPTGLATGERVRVEYDTRNPELVRVAGRTFTLAFLPIGTALAVCWAVVAPTVWLLRRRPRSVSSRPAPSTS